MNKFKYPEEKQALSEFVAKMWSGDVIEINGTVYTMETEEFADGLRYFLSAPKPAPCADYEYIHCRTSDNVAVFWTTRGMAWAISQEEVTFS